MVTGFFHDTTRINLLSDLCLPRWDLEGEKKHKLPVTGAGATGPAMDTDETLPMEMDNEIVAAASEALGGEPVVDNGKPPPPDLDAEIHEGPEQSVNQAMCELFSKAVFQVQHVF